MLSPRQITFLVFKWKVWQKISSGATAMLWALILPQIKRYHEFSLQAYSQFGNKCHGYATTLVPNKTMILIPNLTIYVIYYLCLSVWPNYEWCMFFGSLEIKSWTSFMLPRRIDLTHWQVLCQNPLELYDVRSGP